MFENEEYIYDFVIYYKGDMRTMLIDLLKELHRLPNKDCIGQNDLSKIYKVDTKLFAQLIYEASDMKKRFFELWRKENFDVRKYLEELQELRVWKGFKIAAIVDANLRNGVTEMVQMSYYFDVIKKRE